MIPLSPSSQPTLNPKELAIKIVKFIANLIVVISAILVIVMTIFFAFVDNEESMADESEQSGDIADCNVQRIELHGQLFTFMPPELLGSEGELLESAEASDNVVDSILAADQDPSIKAIYLDVDSYGGEPVAGEEIMLALRNAEKPTVAMIRAAGDSAAYLAASGADMIFASKYSDVGSIGVTASFVENSRKNQKEGLTYVPLTAGKFKDMGSPDRPLTGEEIKLINRDLDIIHENFIIDVATNRRLTRTTVSDLADGSSMLGKMALDNGLIDRLGGEAELAMYLTQQIGVQADICW